MAEISRAGVTVLCVWFIAVGAWSSVAMAATFAAADPPLPDCTSALIPLQGCLEFVTAAIPSPSDDCCKGVLQLHLTDPACLCVLAMNDSTTNIIPGYHLDLAGQLPTLCKIQGASISNCPALLGETNVTNPAATPVASAPLSTGDNGGAFSMRTPTSLRALVFTYLGVVLAAGALINKM